MLQQERYTLTLGIAGSCLSGTQPIIAGMRAAAFLMARVRRGTRQDRLLRK
ncbi:hypothetical protein [Rhodoferax sediminis]|uniref:hypothetical protein n=1 Tax=Rhodoferax sediminis TaxID=2509614 RepID=UPI00143DB21F|nr:hypothetical protein [Rhodoferax sediminis]